MTSLFAYIQQYVTLNPEEAKAFGPLFQKTLLKKDRHFIRLGELVNKVGFLEMGSLRVYQKSESGKEVTRYFVSGPAFTTNLPSYTEGKGASDSYQALTDCQLWVIQKETLERLCQEIPKIAQFKERIIEYSLACKEERVRSLLLDKPQQRYEALLKEQPEIFQRAPLAMIASYLGISRETLHRIRRIR